MDLVPIGSVFEAQGNKVLVLGYRFDNKNDQFITSYIVCGYPLGYTGDLASIPVDADMELIFEGFKNDQFKKFIKYKQELYDLTKTMTVTELNAHLKEMETVLTEEIKEKKHE